MSRRANRKSSRNGILFMLGGGHHGLSRIAKAALLTIDDDDDALGRSSHRRWRPEAGEKKRSPRKKQRSDGSRKSSTLRPCRYLPHRAFGLTRYHRCEDFRHHPIASRIEMHISGVIDQCFALERSRRRLHGWGDIDEGISQFRGLTAEKLPLCAAVPCHEIAQCPILELNEIGICRVGRWRVRNDRCEPVRA